jgi:F-type H+-transporting ATPase subunit alpha
MKGVAGTLKLDQAQFREMEAFAKFGSDLDQATQLTISRGQRNQEILKQHQYAPVKVEEQIAIIFASTKGLLDDVALEKLKEFELDYIRELKDKHKKVMEKLKDGIFDEEAEKALRDTASSVAKSYIVKEQK